MSDATANDPANEDSTPVVGTVDPAIDPADDPSDPAEDPKDGLDAEKSLEKIRKLNSEAAALRKRTKDAEEKAKNAEGSTERVTALEAENMRLKVAVKLNGALPDDLIERLRGATEEEMLEDAEKLLAHFETRKPPTNQPKQKLRGGGDPTQDAGPDDWDKFAEGIFKN